MVPMMIRTLDAAQTISESIVSHHCSVVTFLEQGAHLPARRCRRLFLELFAVSGALLPAAFYLFRRLALVTDAAVAPDFDLSPRDMDFIGVSEFMQTWLLSDHHRLLPLAYLVAGIAVGLVTYIATVSAAVVARRYDSPKEEEVKEEDEDKEKEVEEDDGEEEDREVEEDEEDDLEEDEGEEEGNKKEEEQEHPTLLSFLGTVKRNLARPAKIIALTCGLKAALYVLLGFGFHGALEFMYPAAIVCLLVEFLCKVAVITSIAEEPAAGGQTAVGRACRRLVRGKYSEFLLYQTGQGLIENVFDVACAVLGMAGLPHQVDAGVMCLLLGAKEVLSAANVTGYYFACREKEERKQEDTACHLD